MYDVVQDTKYFSVCIANRDVCVVFQFHYGLGLGLVLAALFEERFSDVAGTQVCDSSMSYCNIFIF